MNLTRNVQTQRLKVDGTSYTLSAGTSDVASEAVDRQGFRGVRFIVGWGAIVSGGVQSINGQTSSDNSNFNDIAGTSITVADTDDNKVTILEIYNPLERYLKIEVLRETQNATVDFLIAELFDPYEKPVAQHSTVQGQEIHVSPAEGTV